MSARPHAARPRPRAGGSAPAPGMAHRPVLPVAPPSFCATCVRSGLHRRERRPAGAANAVAVRHRGRSAVARPALRARRREQRRAASRAPRFEPFIDIDEHGRAGPGAARPRADRRERRRLARRARRSPITCARGVRWQDGVPVTAHDVVWTLHAILDDREPGALARGLRPRRQRRSARRAHGARHAQRTVGAGGRDAVQLRDRAAVRAARAPAAKRNRTSSRALLRASGRRRAVPLRLVVARRPSRLRSELRRTGAERRPWRASTCGSSPIPGRTSPLLRSGGVDWNLLSPAQRASLGTPSRSRFPHRAAGADRGDRAQHDASAARRRARAPRDRGLDRPRRDLEQDHVRALSGRRHGTAARLVGARSGGARAGATIRRRRTGCSMRPAGAAAPTACARRTASRWR